MLALIGPPGTGKSHLLYAAAQKLDGMGVRVLARRWDLLSADLRYGGPAPFSPTHRLEPHELRAKVLAQSVLLFDEVRPTSGTAFDDTELAKIVGNAWDQEGAVLITTNVNPLRDVLGDAPASRFRQVILTGRDHRQA
jgi:DNA replication protein DnaC